MLSVLSVLTLASVGRGALLAFEPNCGSISSETVVDVNAGIDLSSITTIVAFGDGYTDGGKQDGTELDPAVQVLPDPKAGGRLSNGQLWIEYLADSINATLRDFAVTNSVVSNDVYPNGQEMEAKDFVVQSNTLLSQTDKPAGDSTLYVVYHGMEDFRISQGDLTAVSDNIVFQILKLSSSPLFGKNFLVVDSYGRGNTTEAGDAFKQQVFSGMVSARNVDGLNVAFADLGNLLTAMVSDPVAFEFEDIGPCTVDETTTEGQCSNPNATIFYIADYPSTTTHQLMADYVDLVLETCVE